MYETYHHNPYNPAQVTEDVTLLLNDPSVSDKKGVYEFVLGGKTDFKLLNIRLFDEKVKRAAYAAQTAKAKDDGVSNCPLCAHGHASNRDRIYKQNEMEADHVTAWSKHGDSTLDNCEMLCKTHNAAKGNR